MIWGLLDLRGLVDMVALDIYMGWELVHLFFMELSI